MLLELGENPYIKDKLTPLDGAIEALNAVLEEASFEELKVLLFLSGGSALNILSGLDESSFSDNVTLATLDERYSYDPMVNNMSQIMLTDFFTKVREQGANFIDSRVGELESLQDMANRINNEIIKWFDKNSGGKVVATVGIGPDGHIAGIMPFPENPEVFKSMFDDGNNNHMVVGYDADNRNQHPLRVTATFNLIRKIDVAVVHAAGDNKKDAIEKVLAKEGDLATTPARILREIEGKVFLFTDQN